MEKGLTNFFLKSVNLTGYFIVLLCFLFISEQVLMLFGYDKSKNFKNFYKRAKLFTVLFYIITEIVDLLAMMILIRTEEAKDIFNAIVHIINS